MSKFLLINGKPQKAANGEFITVPDAYDNEPISLSGTILKTAVGLIGNKWIAQQEDTNDYLCFTAETANSTIGLTLAGTPTQGQAFEYSLDKKTWNSVVIGTAITLASVGDKVYFRGDNTTVSESSSIYYNFTMTGSIAGSGNVMSLLDKTCESVTISSTYCFYNLFQGCASLTTAPSLPATTLADSCYFGMFRGCTSLTTAPALPAITLAGYCYTSMFRGCTSLTTAPELPATTLVNYCYSGMFSGCTSLTTAPALPAITLAGYCYTSMFSGCTSLTTAPALPAITLAGYCYTSMFSGCTSLNYIQLAYLGKNFSSGYFGSWVEKVSAIGRFDYNGVGKTRGADAIPTGWLVNGKATIPTVSDVAYTGSVMTPTITNPDGAYITVSGDISGTNIGTYTTTFTLNDTSMYMWSDGTTTPKNVQWNITRGKLSVPTAGELYYNGSVLTPIWTNYDDTKMTIGGTVSATEIGTYTATFTITDTTHYASWSDGTTAAKSVSWSITTMPDLLCFTANTANSTIKLTLAGTTTKSQAFEYSLDGSTWNNVVTGTAITLANIGDKIYYRGNNTTVSESSSIYYKFVMTGSIAGSGNVMSLLDKTCESTTISNTYCFYNLFYGCSSLTAAPALPATTLPTGCYNYMFYNCSNIADIYVYAATSITQSFNYFAPATTNIHFGTNLTSITTNVFGSAATINYHVYIHFTDNDTPSFTPGLFVTVGSSKTTTNYTFYTDNTAIKDALLAKADSYTKVTVKHLDGSDW